MNKRTNKLNKIRQSPLLAIIAVILTCAAFGAVSAQDKKSISEKYGARAPLTCENLQGALTSETAKQALQCYLERISSDMLFLLEDVKVQVGAGRPYNPATDALINDIDVKALVYPIRGSFVQYACSEIDTSNTQWNNVGKNCTAYKSPKADGRCWKTAFGDWQCQMSDLASSNDENIRRGVPPPPAKVTE